MNCTEIGQFVTQRLMEKITHPSGNWSDYNKNLQQYEALVPKSLESPELYCQNLIVHPETNDYPNLSL